MTLCYRCSTWASRYKFAPLVDERFTGELVAARLDELFAQHGPPLVLKRDNGSNLNSEAVNAVLSRWLVIPLNSPPYYPPYNGGIERAQRELKAALRPGSWPTRPATSLDWPR